MAFSNKISFGAPAAFAMALIFTIASPAVRAQSTPPVPASDGTSIDQGIAYVLMLLALVLTYLIHTLDGCFGL